MTRIWSLFLIVGVLALRGETSLALGQDTSPPGEQDQAAAQNPDVVKLEFEGLEETGISDDLVRQEMETEEGKPFEEDVLEADYSRLWSSLGLVLTKTPKIRYDAELGGLVIRIALSRTFSIDLLAYQGNEEKTDSELDDVIGIENPSRVRSRRQLELAAQRIVETYREEGYAACQVDVSLDRIGNNKRAIFVIYEGPRVSVDDIQFVGLVETSAGELRDQMETSRSWFIFNQYFREERLDSDLTNIEGYLRSRGYLDAKVSLEDLRYSDARSEVVIVIRVDEGDRFRVSRVEFSGIEAFPEAELRALIKLKPGDDYDLRVVGLDAAAIESYYGEYGYLRARMRVPPDVRYSLDAPTVVVVYHVDERERKKVRDVIIRGNRATDDEVVRRALQIYPGQWFNTLEMRRGVNRLRSLGYFSTRGGASLINITTSQTDDPEAEDLVIDVGEGLLGLLNFSVGTQSGRGAFVGFSIEKPNFDITRLPSSPWAFPTEFFSHQAFHGGGQRLSLNLLPGTRDSRFFIDFEEPYLFGPEELPWSLRVRAFKDLRILREYDVERLGIQPTIGKFLVQDLRVSLTARSELIDIGNINDDSPDDIFAVEGKNGLRSLAASISYDIRDNFRSPTDGMRSTLRYEYAGGFLGADFDFSEAEWTNEFFWPVYSPEGKAEDARHVIFLETRAGWSEAHGGSDQVPIFERFYGGGQDRYLLRGFRFRGVGPRENNDPLGGSAAFVANLEYIFPIFSYFEERVQEDVTFLKGFVSMDYGTIEPTWDDVAFDRFRWSVGLGVRVRIPVPFLSNLPITIHYGVPLKREEFDERRSFNFNFSAGF